MNVAAFLMLLGACSGLVLSLIWFRIAQAPGWRSTRPFAWVALTAAGYSGFDVAVVLELPAWVYPASQRISMAFAAAHTISWIYWFAAMDHQRPLLRRERIVVTLAGFLAIACVIPGAIVTPEITRYHVDWLNVTYRIPTPTTVGFATFPFFVVVMWLVAYGAYRRWRTGWRAVYPMYTISVLSVLGIIDMLSTAGLTGFPLLLDFGFFLMIAGFGYLYLERFLTDAERLEQLSTRLESEVEDRTRQLTQTRTALARSEMLAAVGRLAGGVAHEINNPTAIVLGNLSYLSLGVRSTGRLPEDGAKAIDDAVDATNRIAQIVRQLTDATQGLHAHDVALQDVPVRLVLSNAAATIGARFGAGVAVHITPSPLVVRADPQLLTNVLIQLLSNAVEAALDRRDGLGTVSVTSVQLRHGIEIHVTDNGRGLPGGDADNLFELFRTVGGTTRSRGLGLTVAHGLTKAQGGSLRVVETSSAGTTFAVLLPSATPPSSEPTVSQDRDAPRLRTARGGPEAAA